MIIFKNENYIICKKPVGISSQKTDGNNDVPTAISSEIGVAIDSIHPVHRLDKPVGGTMIYALGKISAAKISEMVAKGNIQKAYLAVIHGKPDEDKGVFKDLLFKDSSKNKSFVVKRMRRGVKEASLEYEVLATAFNSTEEMSLVKILLHTGRTHQIRVQFSHRKMPLAGDRRYGSGKDSCSVALWSYALGFVSPFDNTYKEFSSAPDTSQFPWNLFDESNYR